MHEQDEDLAPGDVADGAGDEIDDGAFPKAGGIAKGAGAHGVDDQDDEDDDEDEDEDEEDGDEEELSLGVALGRLVGLLVDQPEDIHILEEVDAKGGTVFTVQVAPDDLGKLIGRQGRTARSLRNFLEVRGQLDGKSYSLEIREQP
jgi:predicted RNA-binding protein YlqC (UPF0109 family)